MYIEIGDITIKKPEIIKPVWSSSAIMTFPTITEVQAQVYAYAEGIRIGAELNLMEEYHPDLKRHCDAIREYIGQEAERLLGSDE